MGADAFRCAVIWIEDLGIQMGTCAGDDTWGSQGQGVSPHWDEFPAEMDDLGTLSLPCQGTAWLFLGTSMCNSLIPSSAEQYLWVPVRHRQGWEVGISVTLPGTALLTILPLIFDLSLPSSPESARSRGRKRSLLPDGLKCSICNTLSEEITAESLSLIKQPAQILCEPAGQSHALATGGEAMGAEDTGLMVAEGCLDGEEVGLDPSALGSASLGPSVTSLGTSCLCQLLHFAFLWVSVGYGGEHPSLGEQGRRRSGRVDVSPLWLVFQIFSTLQN